MGRIKELSVFLYDRQIGTLAHLPGDKNLFTFDSSYIQDKNRPTLSLSFFNTQKDLITKVAMTRTRLPSFFSNLLPEGALLGYLANQAKLNPKHEFSLLSALGQDLPGAITVKLEGEEDFLASDVKLKSKKEKDLLHFSLAGVQLKFSAIRRMNHGLLIPSDGVGGEWIVKLPHSVFRGVPENEYTMMELARRIGINVPEIALFSMDDLHGLPEEMKKMGDSVFGIKRFDRGHDGNRVHIEDFAQIFGVYPEGKYKNASYRNIAEVIRNGLEEAELKEFIKRFVFNALIGNGDMHLKNWSLIYLDKKRPSLAPAYDFVSTVLYLPEDKLALNFVDSKDFGSLTMDQFKRFAEKAILSNKLVVDTVEETVQLFSEEWKKVKELPVSKEVVTSISEHLKTIPLWKRSR